VCIGEGTFGQVCSGIDTLNDNNCVAIKKLSGLFEGNGKEALRALREINLLSQLQHDNIIPLLDVVIGSPNKRTFGVSFFLRVSQKKKQIEES
jgi:serine/threonine protein kinase